MTNPHELLRSITLGPPTPDINYDKFLVDKYPNMCLCGRPVNGHGKVCCRMCRDYGSHSTLCRRRHG